MLIEFGCKDTTFLLNIITFGRYFIKIFYNNPFIYNMCFTSLLCNDSAVMKSAIYFMCRISCGCFFSSYSIVKREFKLVFLFL